MKYFLGHARDNQHLNFITCCIGSGESTHEHYSDIYEVLATYPDSFADNITHTCGCLRVGGLNSAHDQRPFKRRPQSSRSSLRSSSFNQNNAYYSSPAGKIRCIDILVIIQILFRRLTKFELIMFYKNEVLLNIIIIIKLTWYPRCGNYFVN